MSYNLEEDWVNQLSLTFVIEAAAKLNRDKSAPEVEVDEPYLQSIALEELARILPSHNLKKKEFSIKKDLDFPENKNICADLVIFNPWDDPKDENVYTIIEIKRTYERARNQKEVIQDIARLVVLAKERSISTYLFLCGREENIRKLFTTNLGLYLSTNIQDADKTISTKALSKHLKDDYKKSLVNSSVSEINTKLLRPITHIGYSCYAWRVQSQLLEEPRDKVKFRISESKI